MFIVCLCIYMHSYRMQHQFIILYSKFDYNCKNKSSKVKMCRRKHKIKITYFKKWNTEVKFQISLMNYYIIIEPKYSHYPQPILCC